MDYQTEKATLDGSLLVTERPHETARKGVADFLVVFVKAIHALMLYPPTNPLPGQFRKQFYQAAREVLQDTSSLVLVTTDRAFYHDAEIVFEDEPGETNPAYVLFRDGVREFGLRSSLTEDEANQLLDLFALGLSRTGITFDMANALWEAGIPSVYYRTVDHVFDGEMSPPPDPADYKRPANLFFAAIDLPDEPQEEDEVAPENNPFGYRGLQKDRYLEIQDVFHEGIEPGHEETRQYMALLARDARSDCRGEAIRVYDEIVRSGTTPQTFSEILAITRRQIENMLEHDNWQTVPRLLKTVQSWQTEFADHPALATQLQQSLSQVGSERVLAKMAQYLNAHPEADLNLFRDFLDLLDPASFGAVTSTLGLLEHHPARKLIFTFLGERGAEALDLIGNYIYDKRWYVVRNVALVMGRINSPRAVTFLKKAATHGDSRVQHEVVRSLAEIDGAEADQLLLSILNNPNENLQIQTCKVLAVRPSARLFEVLEARFDGMDLTRLEGRLQKEYLAAFARAGGERALTRLATIIHRRVWFGRARWNKLKIQAIYALGEVNTPAAVKLLQETLRGNNPLQQTTARQVLNRQTHADQQEKPTPKRYDD